MAGRATEAIGVLEPVEPDRFDHYALLAACRSVDGDTLAAQDAGTTRPCDAPRLYNRFVLRELVCLETAEDKGRLRDALQKSGLHE